MAQLTLALAERGIRSSVVRQPPATHGDGDNGFIPTAIYLARKHSASAYVGDGANRWPAVHRNDAAHLFRLALESAPGGSVLHAVGDQGVTIRQVAETIAGHLGVPARVGRSERDRRVSRLSRDLRGFDGPASAEVTRDLLGWQPTRPGLLADLEQGHYFTGPLPH